MVHGKIPVSIVNGRGHIFDINDLRQLREKYHICGVLSGVLPQFPQQNLFMGLPLELLPEDVRYLVELDAVDLVDDRKTHDHYFQSEEPAPELEEGAERVPTASGELQIVPTVKYDEPNEIAYEMYKYLMQNDCFIMPGLRFGCQYMAYPGDPVRYHAHYSAVGYAWQKPFPILDIIGNGRLGTSVKKSWVVGAKANDDPNEEYRVFSVEWAGFG